jgi:hypothetical protein
VCDAEDYSKQASSGSLLAGYIGSYRFESTVVPSIMPVSSSLPVGSRYGNAAALLLANFLVLAAVPHYIAEGIRH